MVSELIFADAIAEPTIQDEQKRMKPLYLIERTAQEKCPRCWKRRPEVSEAQEVCHDCQEALG